MQSDRVIVQPGEVIDRATGEVTEFGSMPISPTEKVTRDDARWPEAVAQTCGTDSHTFVKQADGTYAREVN
jgi:hypothetical protein